MWLSRIAGLNPATSHVIRAWDSSGPFDWNLRQDLLAAFKDERDRRIPMAEEVGVETCADVLV
jgi:hypothetical protein